MIVCKKCKKWDMLKIITPHDKEGYWLECERCNKGQKLNDDGRTIRMFELFQIYVNCLSHNFVYRTLNIDDVKEIVWEAVSGADAN